jgi:hypothetical protein
MQQQEGFLTGMRTYLMGIGIIIHQILIHFGYDVSNEMVSESIDAILAAGAIVFRWMAAVGSKKAVNDALYTPVPPGPKPEVK